MEKRASEPRTCVPVPQIEDDFYDWYARHEAKVADNAAGKFDLVMIGDSLTHFWKDEHNYGEGSWDAFFSGRKVLNLGFGFDRTQNVLWRLEHGELTGQSPRVIVLNIGTNQFSVTERYPGGDSPEDTVRGICKVVSMLLDECPTSKIVVMKLFPRAGKGELIAAVNALLDTMLPDDPRVERLDIGGLLGTGPDTPRPEFYQQDGCHLNRGGYEVWYRGIARYLDF